MTSKSVGNGVDFDSFQIEAVLSGVNGWRVALEVRVDEGKRPYVSRMTLTATAAPPQSEGLTTAVWRSVPIGRLTDDAIAKYREFEPAIWEDVPPDPRVRHGWKVDGPRGHSDETYAALAAAFVARVQAGSRTPLDDVARAMECSKSTANARLQAARRRGLLDGHSAGPRRAREPVRLTDKARDALGYDDVKLNPVTPGEETAPRRAAPWRCEACDAIQRQRGRRDSCVACGSTSLIAVRKA